MAATTQTDTMKYLQQVMRVMNMITVLMMRVMNMITVLTTHLAFLWVTLVLRGSITARNLSKEMAERVRILETIHSTEE